MTQAALVRHAPAAGFGFRTRLQAIAASLHALDAESAKLARLVDAAATSTPGEAPVSRLRSRQAALVERQHDLACERRALLAELAR
jgi:hypothetical protein